MIDLSKALMIGKKYYEANGGLEITKVYESEKMWIMFAKKNGLVRYGSIGISIDKNSGKVEDFFLPSDENFEILDNSTLIKF